METINFKIIDNFRIVDDQGELTLTINGKEVWTNFTLQKKEKKEFTIPKADSYVIELKNSQKCFKKKTTDQLENKLIKVVSRKSPDWLGLRGLMWQGMMMLIAGRYTFKIRKQKK
ncbi:hypothetical protein [Mycoplasma todarodis]|uniref:hypothetical protein n=1 Tax=Mycoplasma todarodis TaxID=1937191 RepID=UPI003B2E18B8